MTKAGQAFGKDIKEFWVNQRIQLYMAALEKTLGLSAEFLKQSQRGRNGGTWAHPKLAVFCAQWLSIEFEVWCNAVIEDMLTKKAELVITKPETSATVQVSQSLLPDFMLAIQQLAQCTTSATMRLSSRSRTPIRKFDRRSTVRL